MAITRVENIEFCTSAEIHRIQEKYLRHHLSYAADNSPFYRNLFRGTGISPAAVSLDSLASLPFTDKQLLCTRNEEFLAVPSAQIVDIVLSSGTTGTPVAIMYTENDLQRLAYNEEVSFRSMGIGPHDRVLLTCTLDRCFIAGLAYFLGTRSVGAAAIRNGLGSVASHREIIERLKPTVIVGVPSFLRKLGTFLRTEGIDPTECGITKLVCIGEPVRDRNMDLLTEGTQLEQLWGARLFSTYASSETITSFCECTARQGGHLHPELAVIEIIDDDGTVVPTGTTGEIVVTPLGIEGMPLVRFKTGDIGFQIDAPCSCGRNSVRLGPILGRKDQRLKVRGTTLYPNAIYAVLDSLPAVSDYYVTVSTVGNLSDTVTVSVAVQDESCTASKISDYVQDRLRVRVDVTIVNQEEITTILSGGNPRKINRFVDKR